MVRLKGLVTWAMSAAVASLAVAAPPEATPSQEELARQVRSLQSEVQQLKAQQLNTADVDATVRQVLQDADRRSQLLAAEGFTAGYSNGKFLIQSADGNFVLHPWLQFQARNITNWRQDENQAPSTNGGDFQNGFEIRRMKFGFDGNVFTPDLTYLFLWATSRTTGGPVLEEAWAKYMFADEWGVRVGQIKDPFAHEGITSSKKLMAVERSYLEDILGLGDNFVQGITLIYGNKDTPIHAEMGLTDGTGSSNTNFQDYPVTGSNWGAAGRVEWLVMGDWKDYDDFSAMGCKKDLLVVGAALDYTEGGDTDVLRHTADIQYENPSGLGLYAAYIGSYKMLGTVGSGAEDSFCDWGFVVQASYLLDKQWEIFARYDFTKFDKGNTIALPGTGVDRDVHEITAGVNYYMQGHAAKITLDATWLPNGVPVADDGSGVLKSTTEGSDQFLLRAQFQLLI